MPLVIRHSGGDRDVVERLLDVVDNDDRTAGSDDVGVKLRQQVPTAHMRSEAERTRVKDGFPERRHRRVHGGGDDAVGKVRKLKGSKPSFLRDGDGASRAVTVALVFQHPADETHDHRGVLATQIRVPGPIESGGLTGVALEVVEDPEQEVGMDDLLERRHLIGGLDPAPRGAVQPAAVRRPVRRDLAEGLAAVAHRASLRAEGRSARNWSTRAITGSASGASHSWSR